MKNFAFWVSDFVKKRAPSVQLFIGIPIIVAIYIGWPWALAAFGEPTATFGLGVFEPIIMAVMYVMIANYAAWAGSMLNDQEFSTPEQRCERRFQLYLLFYCSALLIVAVLLMGGRAPA
jgi:hypothetical protein